RSFEELEVVPDVCSYTNERLSVLGETRASPAWSRTQKVGPDARIETHACGDIAHVRACRLAECRDGIYKAHFRGEECIRGVLDRLSASRVGQHDRRACSKEEASHPHRGSFVLRSYHDSVRMEE